MDDTMAPPSKRRKLLSPAEDVALQSEAASKSSVPPFSHGVEHIPAAKPTQLFYAPALPRHVEEVHLEIHKRSVPSAEERRRILRRQGTAALGNIISTNSDADVVVAVTAEVDALGTTTALTTAAVTVDVPDLPSLLSTSTTTDVISDNSAESKSSTTSETSVEPTSSSAPESSSDRTSASSSPSETASSSNNSRSTDAPSSTNAPSSSTSRSSSTSLPISSSSDSPSAYAISPASENGDEDGNQNESQAETSSEATESGTGSSVAPSSPASTYSARSSASSSQGAASLGSSTSSNSSVPASTSGNTQSQTSQIVIPATASGFIGQTGSASSVNSLNLTTSGKLTTPASLCLESTD